MLSAIASHRAFHFPFAAIVGQPLLKQALLMAAVNPRLRGVLLFGEKGTAKSTAARALADVLPPVPYVVGCPYACNPDAPREWCDACRAQGVPPSAPDLRNVPFVTLPLNATLDRVVGTVHWEHAMRHGEAVLEPGLLAAANGGVLYVDEVNLLDEGIVASLLDAAETGINHVCREGVRASHPAGFILVGTMNPEEGPLPPQLLDRFGLAVHITAEIDTTLRTTLLRRRMAFEADPEAFTAEWAAEQEKIRADISTVRERLQRIYVPDTVLREIGDWCLSHGVAGHRADILLAQAARAIAAWADEPLVTRAHVERASTFVILHRQRPTAKSGSQDGDTPGPGAGDSGKQDGNLRQLRQKTPDIGEKDEEAAGGELTRGSQSQVGQMFRDENSASDAGGRTLGGQFTGDDDEDPQGATHRGERTAHLRGTVADIAEGLHASHLLDERKRHRGLVKGQSGRRRAGESATTRGRYYRARPDEQPTDVAFDATVRAAGVRTGMAGTRSEGQRLEVQRRDLHQKIRRQRTKALFLFVVDASGSLGDVVMSLCKGTVMELLRDAYQKRDRVAMIAFRDYSAPLLLPPTNSVDLARRCLAELPTGGKTPLSAGLVTAYKTIEQLRRRDPLAPITMVLLSDGRANVGLRDKENRPSLYHGGGDARLWEEALRVAEALGQLEGVDIVCVDTTPRHKPPSLLPDLAAQMEARFVVLEDLQVPNLFAAIASAPQAARREKVIRMW